MGKEEKNVLCISVVLTAHTPLVHLLKTSFTWELCRLAP